MPVMLILFSAFYHLPAKMHTWIRINLAEADSAAVKGSAGSWHWNIHMIQALKSQVLL